MPSKVNHAVFPVIALLLGTLVLLPASGLVAVVQFPEEVIDVSVQGDQIEVRALYIYSNPWPFPVLQGFGLPFAIDAGQPAPYPVELFNSARGEPLQTKNLFGLTTFELNFQAGERIPVELYYKQKCSKSKARYLLTTTSSWRRSLVSGVYRVYSDRYSIGSNYPLKHAGGNSWEFRRTNFLPATDWLLSWNPI